MGDFAGHPFRGNQYTSGQNAEAGDVVAHKGERGVVLSTSGSRSWIHVERKGAREAEAHELELISRGAVGYLRDDDPYSGQAAILKRYAEQKDFLPEDEAKALDGRFGWLSMKAAEHRLVVKQVTGKSERELINGLTRAAVAKSYGARAARGINPDDPGAVDEYLRRTAANPDKPRQLTARGKPAGDSENTRRRELEREFGVKVPLRTGVKRKLSGRY